jgi:hypothetical protein
MAPLSATTVIFKDFVNSGPVPEDNFVLEQQQVLHLLRPHTPELSALLLAAVVCKGRSGGPFRTPTSDRTADHKLLLRCCCLCMCAG